MLKIKLQPSVFIGSTSEDPTNQGLKIIEKVVSLLDMHRLFSLFPKQHCNNYFHSIFLKLFAILGFELRAYTLSYSTSPIFVMGFFEIEFLELFGQADFELQS
jgi:hypothetical protein